MSTLYLILCTNHISSQELFFFFKNYLHLTKTILKPLLLCFVINKIKLYCDKFICSATELNGLLEDDKLYCDSYNFCSDSIVLTYSFLNPFYLAVRNSSCLNIIKVVKWNKRWMNWELSATDTDDSSKSQFSVSCSYKETCLQSDLQNVSSSPSSSN